MRLAFWRREAAPIPGGKLVRNLDGKKRRAWLGRSLSSLFKAADVDETDRWTAHPQSIDELITHRQHILVARSREQWSNNDYVRKFLKLMRKNVVGPLGVTMQAKCLKARGKLDKDTNDAIEADWADFCKKGNCDVTGGLSMRELECLVIETTGRDGEFIARLIYGRNAGPHGFAVQMLDPQRLSTRMESRAGADGSFIRHGTEFNSFGRPVAYHFTSTDEWDSNYYSFAGAGYIRVPAEEIIHDFVREVVGQKRGLPWTSTALFRLRNMNGFEQAAVQNARAGANKMGFFQWKEGYGPEADDDTPLSIDASPLSFHELPEGAELAEFAPLFPSGDTAPFLKSQLRGAASGLDVPYCELASDLEGVNFSSIRQGTLDARESYKELQQWLIESFKEKVFAAWLKWRLLNSAIVVKGRPLDPVNFSKYCCVVWQGRRWQWIDPRADVDSALKSIRGGLTSISQVIREQGRDPEAVFAEFAEDLKAMKAAGIPDDVIQLFLLGQPPQQQKQEEPADPAGETKPTETNEGKE